MIRALLVFRVIMRVRMDADVNQDVCRLYI